MNDINIQFNVLLYSHVSVVFGFDRSNHDHICSSHLQNRFKTGIVIYYIFLVLCKSDSFLRITL